MTTVLLSLLGLWVLLGAVWLGLGPLFGARGASVDFPRTIELNELRVEKDRLVAEIHEAELDHETGKLSAEDFAAIEARLKARAVEVLRRIDELESGYTGSEARTTR